jgi:4-carboxymuconolactone decarboxylase
MMSNERMSHERLGPVPKDQYDDAQKAAHADFMALRKVDFSGPWHVFIRSPELLTAAQRMGEYLRYRCSMSGRLSEIAILLVARFWTQDYEWGAHRKMALKAGVEASTIEAIRDGRRPSNLTPEEQSVYDFVSELLQTKRVSDATFAHATALFGENGVIDLCGIVGYYQLLALTMNVARTPAPEGEAPLPRFPD